MLLMIQLGISLNYEGNNRQMYYYHITITEYSAN